MIKITIECTECDESVVYTDCFEKTLDERRLREFFNLHGDACSEGDPECSFCKKGLPHKEHKVKK